MIHASATERMPTFNRVTQLTTIASASAANESAGTLMPVPPLGSNGMPKGKRRKGTLRESLNPRVLGLGLFKDRDAGVGVFPEGEEILVGSFCFGPIS